MTATEYRQDRVELGAVQVEETPDFYVIRDCIAGREGVFNDAYRPWKELRKSYRTLDGKPIIVHHPPEDAPHYGLLAVYPEEIHGFTQNVRKDDAKRHILYDAVLFRRVDVDGHETTPEVVAFNEQLVAALRDGIPIDNSPGYQTRVQRASGTWGGKSYSEIRHDFGYWHVAIVPQGACGWDDHCGMGRGQDEKEGDHDMPPKTEDPKPADLATLQAEIDRLKECATKRDATEKELKEALDAQKTQLAKLLEKKDGAATPAGQPAADPPGLAEVKKQLDALQAAQKAAADERKAEQDKRLGSKRQKLAQLRELKGDAAKALDAYPEAALDDAIAREEALRARGDGLSFEAAGDGTNAALGPTVGVWDAKKGEYVATQGGA